MGPDASIGRAAIGGLLLAMSSLPASAEVVEIRIPSQVAPNVVAALAAVAEEATVTALGGESIQQIVERECGAMPPVYYSLLGDANPGLELGVNETLAIGTEIKLPACAPPPQAAPRTLAVGDMLSDFLAPATVPREAIDETLALQSLSDLYDAALTDRIDIASPFDRSVFGSAQAAARISNEIVLGAGPEDLVAFDPASWDSGAINVYPVNVGSPLPDHGIAVTGITDPNILAEGATVLLPAQLPQSRTLRLKQGVAYDEAVAAIAAAVTLDGLSAPAPVISPGQLLTLPRPMLGGQAICLEQEISSDNWPLPWEAIVKQLEANERQRQGEVGKFRLLVLDTGFDLRGRAPAFPDEYFPPARDIPTDTPIGVITGAGWTRDGVNLATPKSGASSISYPVGGRDHRWHGAAVMSAALGSRQFEGRPLSASLGIVPASAISGFAMAEPAALERALKYAQHNDIEVINYSFATNNNPELELSSGDVLLVVPAGNDGQPVGAVWPARYGGGEGPVVTVGGHEPSGKIWSSSNRSNRFVDLLAPSCSIPVYEGEIVQDRIESVPALVAGTSFAAPLVSFVAGLLAAEGLTPAEIKIRLNISARLHPDAIRWTYSGGLLNAPTALSLYSDVLVLESEDGPITLQGRFKDESTPVRLCDDDFYIHQLQKIGAYSANGEGRLRYWSTKDSPITVDGVEVYRGASDCQAEDIAFTADFLVDDGTVVAVDGADVLDYTRRYGN